ncbi:MAG: hypothetical protein Q8P81_03145 [Nanoarchaeota archaeon]|nr:hypothetical protein [Nanoarchaeota archaeon]
MVYDDEFVAKVAEQYSSLCGKIDLLKREKGREQYNGLMAQCYSGAHSNLNFLRSLPEGIQGRLGIEALEERLMELADTYM